MKYLLSFIVVLTALTVKGQSFDYSDSLHVVKFAQYKEQVKENSNNQLVEIIPAKTGILLDVRYATTNNFMHAVMYPQARAFARLPVYHALLAIQHDLEKQGLGLKIFDGYRPYNITVKFYNMTRDTSFVANPAHGSKHNRGCAIDLTIVDLKTGKEIEMPTGYDSFTKAAAAKFEPVSATAKKNRQLLQDEMTSHGFQILPTEWWHFDFIGWQQYKLLDIPFSQL
ncbi:M15 family metallopeptidase [Mucilaginibacter ginkgonis]|nr:M15 family metallopeptidase [Mucilaginibacter ginkgonis]